MTTRKELQAQLRKLRAEEKAAGVAFRKAAKEWERAQAQTRASFGRMNELASVYLTAHADVKTVKAELQAPAVAQAITTAPAPKHVRVGSGRTVPEPMSVEKIARHLQYGASGRTRTEIAKTIESAVSKIREKLGEP